MESLLGGDAWCESTLLSDCLLSCNSLPECFDYKRNFQVDYDHKRLTSDSSPLFLERVSLGNPCWPRTYVDQAALDLGQCSCLSLSGSANLCQVAPIEAYSMAAADLQLAGALVPFLMSLTHTALGFRVPEFTLSLGCLRLSRPAPLTASFPPTLCCR